jgi:hypothetical protein
MQMVLRCNQRAGLWCYWIGQHVVFYHNANLGKGFLRGFSGKIAGAVMVWNMGLEIAEEGGGGHESCGFPPEADGAGWWEVMKGTK